MIVSVLPLVFGLSSVFAATGPALAPPAVQPAAVLGVEVIDLPPAAPRRFGTTGVYITRVAPGGPAEEARLLPGDVLRSVAGVAVDGPAAFKAATMTLRVGTPVALEVRRYGEDLTLRAVPASPGSVYSSTPLCEPDAAASELGAAAVSARRRDADNEFVHASRALDLSEVCASLEPRDDGAALLRTADAFAAAGTALRDRGEAGAAAAEYANAWTLDARAASAPGSSGDERRAATRKAAALEHEMPGLRAHVDPAILAGLAYAGAGLGAHPFSVIDTWSTPADGYSRVLHLRVSIDAARDALLYANGFRVSVPTIETGDEVFFAQGAAAPASVRVHVPSDHARADIAPNEDLGRLGHAYVTANQPATSC